jgi:hypothetical protein
MPRLILPRPVFIPIGPSIAYVELTQGQFALIDAEDVDKIGRFQWFAAKKKNTGQFYAHRKQDGRIVRLHNEIAGHREGLTVDHRQFERTLDNRKANLRHAGRSVQMWNRRKFRNNTSGFIGAFHDKRNGAWRAIIIHVGVRIDLGTYTNKIDAAKAYDKTAFILRGKDAKLNFPGGVLSNP